MNRFRCIGGDCEDTCCASWGVEVSEPIVQAIEAAIGPKQTLKMISPYVELHRKKERYGRIRMPPYQTCSMLSGGMCGLQVAHGADVLPRTCVSYPRSHSSHGDHQVLGGFLSCPEVARQALLSSDALELLDEPIPDMRMNTDQIVDRDNAYYTLREHVSAAMAEYGRDRPIQERLWLLARLAAASVARFNRTTTNPELICSLIDSFGSPHYQADLVEGLSASPRQEFEDAFLASLRLLAEDTGIYVKPRARVAQSLAVVDAEGFALGRARWPALELQLTDALDNYVRFSFLSRWYTDGPDLSNHVENILLKLALIRLLVRTAPTGETPQEAFIQAVYGVERMVEHDAWRFRCHGSIRRIKGSYFELLSDWSSF